MLEWNLVSPTKNNLSKVWGRASENIHLKCYKPQQTTEMRMRKTISISPCRRLFKNTTGDLKTKVGCERSGRDRRVIAPHKIVVMNENGAISCWLVCNEWLSEDLSFCISLANLGVINWRWENQLDHIAIKCSKIKIVLRRCKSKERSRYILWPSSTSCKDKGYLALKITEAKTKKSNTEKLKDSNSERISIVTPKQIRCITTPWWK